jgi:predicted tellurium resistance membrane protein TerC
MFELLSNPTVWASLATLTLMEIVLGIDNIIFISILAGKLPAEQQGRARIIGLSLACITRFLLLLAINWIASLTEVLFTLWGHGFAGRDLILLGGGAFLVYKATKEIHEKLEGPDESGKTDPSAATGFAGVIVQIVLLDIIFSLDSVITAVGMAEHIEIMMAAVIIALAFMMWIGKAISDFVMRHPTVKMLALAFLLLIGVSLAAEAFHKEIPKGYIYTAMAFSVLVEMLNLAMQRRKAARGKQVPTPVHLRQNVVGVQLEQNKTDASRRSS